MLAKNILSMLSKAQMQQFLGLPRQVKESKESKEQLGEKILQLIEEDVREEARLLDMFPLELAVKPTELDELLQCTRAERRRWVKEGRIPILEYRPFRKAGRDMLYPVHDRRVVLGIERETIAQWRAEYHARVHEHRRQGMQVAIQQRKANRLVRREFFKSWEETVEQWGEQGSTELAATLQLAYWTQWASRWAKENHLKALKGTKHSATYASREKAWYERKNIAMYVLTQTPYARLSFYYPEEPDKYILHLCAPHFEQKEEEYYSSIWEFFYANTTLVKQCPDCIFAVEKHFYSLYHVEVSAEVFPELSFSFHMPYPIGKRYFPEPATLPSVKHIEQDGMFRFGRALLDDEKSTHRERDVLTYFENALAEVKVAYAAIGKEIRLTPLQLEA
jgi:hypothetical protein